MDIDSVVQQLSPLFQQARTAHELFKKDWDKNFPKIGQSYAATPLYQSRREKMFEANNRIDAIILPVIAELKGGSKTNIKIVFGYLAVPDRYFRSGYNKEAILHALKRIDLDKSEVRTVESVWSSVQPSLGGREKKAFGGLLEKIHAK